MLRSLLSLFVLLLVTSSCSTIAEDPWAGSDARPQARRAPRDLTVQISNEHYQVVSIFAIWEDMNYPLGDVQGGSTQSFRIPYYLLDSHGGPRFRAMPRGAALEQTTDPVDCLGAHRVEWRLKRNLHPSRPRVMIP